jgi:hypothetical protein
MATAQRITRWKLTSRHEHNLQLGRERAQNQGADKQNNNENGKKLCQSVHSS